MVTLLNDLIFGKHRISSKVTITTPVYALGNIDTREPLLAPSETLALLDSLRNTLSIIK